MQHEQNETIISVREYKSLSKQTSIGFASTSSINNCNNIQSKGIRYNAELEPELSDSYRTSPLPVLSIAGRTFGSVISSLRERHAGMAAANLHLLSFSIFDRIGQDWNSDFWKLGYGCVAYYGRGGDGIVYESDNTLNVFKEDFSRLIEMSTPMFDKHQNEAQGEEAVIAKP